jgi:hypothetical protein
MKQNDAQIHELINTLLNSTPRAAYQASKELTSLGTGVEERLISHLPALKDEQKLIEIVQLLQSLKISQAASVEAIIRLLNHRQKRIRSAAAQCLLQSSPKLRPFLSQLKSALKHETDAKIQGILQKLLSRYPQES